MRIDPRLIKKAARVERTLAKARLYGQSAFRSIAQARTPRWAALGLLRQPHEPGSDCRSWLATTRTKQRPPGRA